MTAIRYDGQLFELQAQQSVLDALTAGGVPVPHGCKAGICQSCLMRAVRGAPPPEAQRGLKDSLRRFIL